MARAVLGPLIQDLRGRLGNQVFDNYKGVHVVRSLPTVTTNPQSYHQTVVRTALSQFIIAWRSLTLSQKQAWEQVAAKLIRGKESDARMNRGGLISVPRGPFSAYNAFIALNLNRYLYGYSVLTDVLTDAPNNMTLPEPLLNFSAVVVARTITASWQYINPGPLTQRLGIWIKSNDAGIHPQLIYTEARNANGSASFTEARKTSGITVDLPNGVYQLQAIIVDNNGLTTSPSELVFVQLGGADVFTYFATRQTVLALANVVADVAWTEIDLSALIPAGAHTAILAAEGIVNVAGGQPAVVEFRRDATQGAAHRYPIAGGLAALPGGGFSCPLTSARKIEYFINIAAPMDMAVNVFLVGYIE